MLAYSLFSGSKGNSTYIAEGKDSVLIDCGKSMRAIENALRRAELPFSPRAIFITHEHSDHISALPMLAKRFAVPIYASPLVCNALAEHSYAALLCPLEKDSSVRLGALTLSAHPLPHDSAANVAYLISSECGDTLGIATDMGVVQPSLIKALSCCRSVMIESNHDIDMLKNGQYPPYLKARILSQRGHLSNTDCAELAVALAERGVKNITLAHLSEENNTPELAFAETSSRLKDHGFTDVRLSVAGSMVKLN